MHPIYTRKQLESKKIDELKAIASQLGAVAKDKRVKQSWIDAILEKQPQSVEVKPQIQMNGDLAEVGVGREPAQLPQVGDSHLVGNYFLRCAQVGQVGSEYAAVWDVSCDGVVMGEISMSWDCSWTHTMSFSKFATPQEAVANLYESLQELCAA